MTDGKYLLYRKVLYKANTLRGMRTRLIGRTLGAKSLQAYSLFFDRKVLYKAKTFGAKSLQADYLFSIGEKMKEKISRLDKITIPSYTKGEEIFNMSSHIVGVALGITATVLCIVRAAINNNVYGIVGGSIFGATMIILYCMSSIYHGLSPRINAKKVFRVLDHCAIYFLVAGTYTPVALCTIREYSTALGWTLFGIIWGIAFLGTTLTAISVEKTKILEIVLYLGMGWSVLFAKDALVTGLGIGGLIFFIAGGLAYTIGAVLYLLGKKHVYIHSVFHLFILAGSVLHFFGILFYVV